MFVTNIYRYISCLNWSMQNNLIYIYFHKRGIGQDMMAIGL